MCKLDMSDDTDRRQFGVGLELFGELQKRCQFATAIQCEQRCGVMETAELAEVEDGISDDLPR